MILFDLKCSITDRVNTCPFADRDTSERFKTTPTVGGVAQW